MLPTHSQAFGSQFLTRQIIENPLMANAVGGKTISRLNSTDPAALVSAARGAGNSSALKIVQGATGCAEEPLPDVFAD